MDLPEFPSMILPWLDLSHAVAIRQVSRKWWKALPTSNEAFWDNIFAATYGPAADLFVYRALNLRGWALVKHVHRDIEKDDWHFATLQPSNIVCLVELFWVYPSTNGGFFDRLLASFLVDDDFQMGGVTTTRNLPESIKFPNYHDLFTHMQVRVTLFRSDTQRRLSCRLARTQYGSVHPGPGDRQEHGYQAIVRGRNKKHIKIFNLMFFDPHEDDENQMKLRRVKFLTSKMKTLVVPAELMMGL